MIWIPPVDYSKLILSKLEQEKRKIQPVFSPDFMNMLEKNGNEHFFNQDSGENLNFEKILEEEISKRK